MAVEDDLVCRQGDQRAAAHRVVRHDRDDLAVVIVERLRDLARCEDEAARRVQDDLDPLSRRSAADRAEHGLGVVDVDVTHQRKAEKGDRLLAMDQRDDGRVALFRDAPQHPTPGRGEEVSLDDRLERAEDEEEPDGVPGVHAP